MLRPDDVSIATADAIRTLLVSLHARIPLKLWMVTAIEGRDWQLVFTHNAGCNLSDQQLNTWLGRFCAMLCANEYRADESFVEQGVLSAENGTDINRAVKAYIGVPLLDDSNRLIGALCGVDSEPDVAGIRSGEALVRQTATLLSRLLSTEAHVATQRMLVNKWSDATRRDELTGLLNRRGWDELMHLPHFRWGEELQGVIVIDIGLHGVSGEAANARAVLLRTASALTVSMRGQDAVARLGDDSFGIVLRCDGVAMVESVVARIERELATAGVSAVTGYSTSPPATSLYEAFVCACAGTRPRRHALSSAD